MRVWGLVASAYALCFPLAQAQILKGGQIFTNGLAIVDSPQPNTPLHAGSNINIAIDVSGNGKLSQPAFSGVGFDSLRIYLVSSENGDNITVSDDPALLTQEPGSTVKHLNWQIPTCVQPGGYNITFYEESHMAGSQFFTITPIPVTIDNNSQTGPCSNLNTLEAQPQPFSSYPQNPILAPQPSTTVNSVVTASSTSSGAPTNNTYASASAGYPAYPAAPTQPITVTLGTGGVQWPMTVTPPNATIPIIVIQPTGFSEPIVITIAPPSATQSGASKSSSDEDTVTVVVTSTATPTPVTVVFVSKETLTQTLTVNGQTTARMTTEYTFSTTAAVMAAPDGNTGFLPINAVSSAAALALPGAFGLSVILPLLALLCSLQ